MFPWPFSFLSHSIFTIISQLCCSIFLRHKSVISRLALQLARVHVLHNGCRGSFPFQPEQVNRTLDFTYYHKNVIIINNFRRRFHCTSLRIRRRQSGFDPLLFTQARSSCCMHLRAYEVRAKIFTPGVFRWKS